jgi:hypothetical protein
MFVHRVRNLIQLLMHDGSILGARVAHYVNRYEVQMRQ